MSTNTDGGGITTGPANPDTERLAALAGVALVGVGVWVQRDRWLGALEPYGLTARPHPAVAPRSAYDPAATTAVGSAHPHLTSAGWLGVVIVAAAAVGVLAAVAAGVAWQRWRRGGGTAAVPPIPVWAGAAGAGGAVWASMVWLTQRPLVAAVLAAAVAAAVMLVATPVARGYRVAQVWRGLAEQVLGHGHPGLAHVRTGRWEHRAAGAWPGRIEASTGPGWQHKPAELAELQRHCAAVGWPRYTWQRDLMRRTVIGTAVPTRAARPATPVRAPARITGHPPTVQPPAIAGGWLGVDEHGQPVTANPRGACLVIGPPGSGKTQAVVMPSVATAPGPVVSTSIKAEVLAATAAARSRRGKVWWFDPGGTEPPPPGATRLVWNPLVDIPDWDAARSMAARLAAPARKSDAGDHWIDRAESWLSVLLVAARISHPGGDLENLARWAMAPTASGAEVEALLIVAAEDGTTGAEIARQLLNSLLSAPDRERESIASTLARLLNIYTSPAAIEAGLRPNFDAAAFVRSAGDSVYIAAPVDRQRDYAPLIAGLLESIRLAQYRRRQAVDLGRETQSVPVTFVLDEAANTAPIPLPNIVSEAGGQGLHLIVALQDMSQARARWGEAAAGGFLTMFPDKVVLSGMADRTTADMLCKMSGEYDRLTVSAAHNAGFGRWQGRESQAESYSANRTPVLSIADITGVPNGRGLHWSPAGWQLLTLTPWWQQRQHYGV